MQALSFSEPLGARRWDFCGRPYAPVLGQEKWLCPPDCDLTCTLPFSALVFPSFMSRGVCVLSAPLQPHCGQICAPFQRAR